MKPQRFRISSVVVLAALLWILAATAHFAYLNGLMLFIRPPLLGNKISAPPPMQQQNSAILSSSSSSSSSSTSLAYEQSFGFFDDITDHHWKMYQRKARTMGNQNHGTDPLLYWDNATAARIWYSLNYEPLFTCPHVWRVGGVGDGPKWVCDPYRIKNIATARRNNSHRGANDSNSHKESTCLVYSIGSNGDYSFEDSLIDLLGEHVCEIHVFDPGNFSRPENALRNIHYHPWGLKSSYDDSLQRLHAGEMFVSLPEIIAKLGHENRTIDIFKADCERCEWYGYKDWIQHADIRQLLIETHRLPYFETTDYWPYEGTNVTPMQFFDDLQANNFILFSKEPNIQGDGDFIEWAYIKLHPDFLHGD